MSLERMQKYRSQPLPIKQKRSTLPISIERKDDTSWWSKEWKRTRSSQGITVEVEQSGEVVSREVL